MVMLAKKILILCLMLSLLPFTFAADGGSVGDTTRLWSDVILGDSLYDAENATLTLYNANGTTIVSNYNMTLFSTGLYYYDFVPNTTGNYLGVIEVYNTTSKITTRTGELYITENETVNNMILAMILGILGLGFLAAYISHNIKLEEIPTGRIIEKALYYAISFVFLLGTPILLLIVAENNASLSYLEGFLNTSVVVTSLAGLAIMVFYFIYHMRKRLERLGKIQEETENDHTK